MPRLPTSRIRQRYDSNWMISPRPYYPQDLPRRRWLFQQKFGYPQRLYGLLKPSVGEDGGIRLQIPQPLQDLNIPIECASFMEEIARLTLGVEDLQKALAAQPRCPEVLVSRCEAVVMHCKNINIRSKSPKSLKKTDADVSHSDAHWRFNHDTRHFDVSRFILNVFFLVHAIEDLEEKRQKAIVPPCQASHYQLCKENWETIVKRSKRMLRRFERSENILVCWEWLENLYTCQSGPSHHHPSACNSDSYWECATSEWEEMMKDPIAGIDKSVRNLWDFKQYDHGADY